MSLKLHPTWSLLLLAIPSVYPAEDIAQKRTCVSAPAIQPHNAHEWEAAEQGCLRALDVVTKTQGDQQPTLYRIYSNLASLYESQNHYTEAERYYNLAYRLAKTLFGHQSQEVVTALSGVGKSRLEQGRIQEADASLRQVLRILESQKDANKLDIATILNNLAALQHMTGNVSRAAELMRKVVTIFESDPSVDEETLGTALSNLATMLRAVGNLPEAMTAARRAAAILERCRNSERFAASLVIQGRLHLDEGNVTGAEAIVQRALRSIDNLSTGDTPTRALVFGYLGVIYAKTGRPREAEQYFQRAVEINQHLLAPEHPKLLESMGAYAEFLRMTKRKGEAKRLEAYIREHREKYRLQNPSAESIVDVRSLVSPSGR